MHYDYDKESDIPATVKESIREVILSLLNTWSIKIPLVPIPYDEAFHELCIAEATHRGYNLEDHSLGSFIRGGVVLATTAYAHLPDQNIKILIALWMACFIYIDDKFLQDSGPIYRFQDRFIRGIPQEDHILEVFANLVREISSRLHRVTANIFVTSTLNGVTGVLLEKETQGIQVPSVATRYPTYSRIMSVAAEAYAILVFPVNLPFNSYIHAIPEVMNFFMNVNDIISFYKEELAGESVNRISLLASCKKRSKIDTLHSIASETIESHRNALEILQSHEDATDMYKCYCQGMIDFHTSLSNRYKLGELRLTT